MGLGSEDRFDDAAVGSCGPHAERPGAGHAHDDLEVVAGPQGWIAPDGKQQRPQFRAVTGALYLGQMVPEIRAAVRPDGGGGTAPRSTEGAQGRPTTRLRGRRSTSRASCLGHLLAVIGAAGAQTQHEAGHHRQGDGRWPHCPSAMASMTGFSPRRIARRCTEPRSSQKTSTTSLV
jgi:hypothetical protein